jgi:hypothetical protein
MAESELDHVAFLLWQVWQAALEAAAGVTNARRFALVR